MSARIAPGELGTITVRPRGASWTAQANGRDLAGFKRTVHATGTTKKDAKKVLRRKWESTTVASGRSLTKHSTIRHAAAVWLDESRSAVSAESLNAYRNRALNITDGRGTRGKYRGVRDREGGVGAMPLKMVTLSWVRREVLRTREEYGNAAAMETYSALRAILRTAVLHEALPYNPASGAVSVQDLPRSKDVHALRPDAFRAVWSALEAWGVGEPTFRVEKGRLMSLLQVGLLGALRCGEALAIREQDILADRIRISGTIVQPAKGPAYRQPFTKTRENSFVEFTPELHAVIEEQRRAMVPNAEGLLFASRAGTPIPVVNIGRTMRKFSSAHEPVFKALDFPHNEFTFHVMRRTAATLLQDEFGEDAARQALAHHGTTALRHYAAAPELGVTAESVKLLSSLF
ncbi:tyrosine-type recombinase/integrase [Microbacterium sp.]|uniref:tyrosine-type recombinase/integrase n=1 Tax=Microbacterium sp. TaxID=51671 RepID=UPI002735627F|nr:tyrosine-type recombinase/integrase [Microbacterium sp.]MDP3951162.1 hypothetical protein [Microbacterium sp.]